MLKLGAVDVLDESWRLLSIMFKLCERQSFFLIRG